MLFESGVLSILQPPTTALFNPSLFRPVCPLDSRRLIVAAAVGPMVIYERCDSDEAGTTRWRAGLSLNRRCAEDLSGKALCAINRLAISGDGQVPG